MIANKDAHSKWQVDTPYKMLFEMPQKDSKKSTRCFAAGYNSLIASYDSLSNEIPLINQCGLIKDGRTSSPIFLFY
jgi:hypothetical protein